MRYGHTRNDHVPAWSPINFFPIDGFSESFDIELQFVFDLWSPVTVTPSLPPSLIEWKTF